MSYSKPCLQGLGGMFIKLLLFPLAHGCASCPTTGGCAP